MRAGRAQPRRAFLLLIAVGLALVVSVVVRTVSEGETETAQVAVVSGCGEQASEAASGTIWAPAAEAFAQFHAEARLAAARLDALGSECEILLVPRLPLDEAGMRALAAAVPDGFEITRVHVAFPGEGRTTLSHFAVAGGASINQAITSWRAEVEFATAENLEESTRVEVLQGAPPGSDDAAELAANLEQSAADAAHLLEQLETGTYVVYGLRVAPNGPSSNDSHMALVDLIEIHGLGAVALRRGGSPVGFRSPVDPAGDRTIAELRAEGRIPAGD